MGNYITYGHSLSSAPPDFATILGANYYEDWNFNEPSTITLMGSEITQINSLGLNGFNLSSPSGNRPLLVNDATLGVDVAEFDGVSEFLRGPLASDSAYKFLHNGSGGCVIVVTKSTLSGATQVLLGSCFGAAEIGYRNTLAVSNFMNGGCFNGSGSTQTSTQTTNTMTLNSWDSVVTSIDNNNATTLDRMELVLSGTSSKTNTNTLTPSTANSTSLLYLCRNPSTANAYYKGQVARVIIADTIPTPTQLAQIQTRLEYDYGTFPI